MHTARRNHKRRRSYGMRRLQTAHMASSTPSWTRLLTIVVSSSPVPSNPDTTTLQAGFRSLAIVPGLSRCAKIIQFDGPQPSLPRHRLRDYVEFKRRVQLLSTRDAAFFSSTVYASNRFLFASHNLAAAVGHVNTTFFFSLQHDYQLVRPFDAAGLLSSMLAMPIIKHVRLNMRPNAPARGFDGVVANATLPGLRVPLTRTCGWSDAPHIASAAYYREFVIPRNRGDHGGGRRKFMEESLHYPMQRNFLPGGCWETKQQVKKGLPPTWPADFDLYGTYLYGHALPTDGSYTLHRSLRGNMPQWGLEHDPKGDIAWRVTKRAAAKGGGGGGSRGGSGGGGGGGDRAGGGSSRQRRRQVK